MHVCSSYFMNNLGWGYTALISESFCSGSMVGKKLYFKCFMLIFTPCSFSTQIVVKLAVRFDENLLVWCLVTSAFEISTCCMWCMKACNIVQLILILEKIHHPSFWNDLRPWHAVKRRPSRYPAVAKVCCFWICCSRASLSLILAQNKWWKISRAYENIVILIFLLPSIVRIAYAEHCDARAKYHAHQSRCHRWLCGSCAHLDLVSHLKSCFVEISSWYFQASLSLLSHGSEMGKCSNRVVAADYTPSLMSITLRYLRK